MLAINVDDPATMRVRQSHGPQAARCGLVQLERPLSEMFSSTRVVRKSESSDKEHLGTTFRSKRARLRLRAFSLDIHAALEYQERVGQ
jgi:hypothetical protein